MYKYDAHFCHLKLLNLLKFYGGIFSLLLQTMGARVEVVCLCYEQAIFDVDDLSGKRELWLR